MAAAPELKLHRSVTKGLKRFDADRLRWLDEAAALGPLVALRMGPVRTWILTDPELARTILVTDGGSWVRPPTAIVPIRIAAGENLFTQSEKAWARVQPAVAPAFRRRAIETRLAEVDGLVEDEVRAIPYDTTVDLELAMSRIALIVAAWVLLGERLDRERAEEIAHHQRAVVGWVGEQLGRLTGFIPVAPGARGRAMKAHRKVIERYGDEVIARARAGRAGADDALATLLAVQPGGRALTHRELREHLLGLFLAGNETTGAALMWGLVHASNAPAEWAKLRADAPRYVNPYVVETLRLTPAVWGIPRTPNRAGVMLTAGAVTVRVRRGQIANVYLRGIHRDPFTWSDPLRFDPSRHAADVKEQQRALLPFGLGSRGCIGQQLAMAELRAVLPALARRGDIVIDGPVVEDPSFTLRIRGGLRGRLARVAPSGQPVPVTTEPTPNRARRDPEPATPDPAANA